MAVEIVAAFRFLHKQRELFQGTLCRVRVNSCNRPRMAAVDVAQVENAVPSRSSCSKMRSGLMRSADSSSSLAPAF
jgi:hypothetical protein